VPLLGMRGKKEASKGKREKSSYPKEKKRSSRKNEATGQIRGGGGETIDGSVV